jgi:SSS family transporter
MSWLGEHWLPVLLVGGYLALLAHHAWAGSRHTSSLADYLIAGRRLGGVAVAFSFYATFVSTNSFIGQAGKSWEVGLVWYVKAFVFIALCYIAWYFVAPRFVAETRACNSVTVADYLGTRYGSAAVRRAAGAVIFGASVFYLVAVYKGSALALEHFLGLPYEWAAIVIFVVVTLYTLAGGFYSVVATDVLQGIIMSAGAVAMLAVVLTKGGGLGPMLASLREQDPDLVSWRGKLPLATLVGLALAGGLKFLVEPRQLSRFYGLRDATALRRARVLAPLLVLVTYLCLMPVGALAHALIPPDALSDSDEVIPYLLGTADLFGPVLSSLFLLVLISAAMSSLDSVLLVGASAVGHDLLIRSGNDAQAIVRTRAWVVVLSLVSMLLALNPFGDIVEITAFSGSLYGACFLPTLVLGLYWRRGTAAGALACMYAGTASVVGWFLAKRWGWTDWHEVFVGLAVGTLAYVGASWATAPAAAIEDIEAEIA